MKGKPHESPECLCPACTSWMEARPTALWTWEEWKKKGCKILSPYHEVVFTTLSKETLKDGESLEVTYTISMG